MKLKYYWLWIFPMPHVVQLRRRNTVLEGLQFLRRNDDAHLPEFLKPQVVQVEFDSFELVGTHGMVVPRLETFRVFRIVGKAHEFLGYIAGPVRTDTDSCSPRIWNPWWKRLRRYRSSGGRTQVVARERLCRRDLVLVVLLPELGDGLHGTVLLVVEQQRLTVVRGRLLGGLIDRRILILFRHNTNVFSETIKWKSVFAANINPYMTVRKACLLQSAAVRSRLVLEYRSIPETGYKKRPFPKAIPHFKKGRIKNG